MPAKKPQRPAFQEALDLLERHGTGPGAVLSILNDLQEAHRHVPADVLFEVAAASPWSFAGLCAVVSAFDDLTLEPIGEHLVCVCDGTACHGAGAVDLVHALEERLGVACGATAEDGSVTLKTVHCVGACSLAPVVVVDGVSSGRIRLSRLDEILPSNRPTEEARERPREGDSDQAHAKELL